MKNTKRKVDDKTILDKFVEEFCRIVEKHVSYIVCSGFVAIAHGRTRGTEDIDMIIEKISKENEEKTKNILPIIGKLFSKDNVAYGYLSESASIFPYGEKLNNILRKVGFIEVKAMPQTFGVATIYTASKSNAAL